MFGTSRQQYWNDIAQTVNDVCNTYFTGTQCKNKFNSLTNNFYVSKNVSNNLHTLCTNYLNIIRIRPW